MKSLTPNILKDSMQLRKEGRDQALSLRRKIHCERDCEAIYTLKLMREKIKKNNKIYNKSKPASFSGEIPPCKTSACLPTAD